MRTLTFNSIAALAIAAIALVAVPARAADLPAPSGDVVLEITGKIERKNSDTAARLDMAFLKSLPRTSFSTATIWTKGVVKFEGVELATLLAAFKASGTTISAIASNDYRVTIPVSDAQKGGPIVAYAMDGKPMSRRTTGPLWIVYPYDKSAAFRSEVIYSRSIWQLVKMDVQ